VSMPSLTHLSVQQELTRQNARLLAAVRLDTLRSLDVRMDLPDARCLQGCTQLKALTLHATSLKGVSAVS
jgi:hypothetical protein